MRNGNLFRRSPIRHIICFKLISDETIPTPTASMVTLADMVQAKFAGNNGKRPSYQEAKAMGPEGTLNPEYIEYLMGFPKGWTAV